jgi:hypothetical protein
VYLLKGYLACCVPGATCGHSHARGQTPLFPSPLFPKPAFARVHTDALRAFACTRSYRFTRPAPRVDHAVFAHTVKAPAPSLSLGGRLIAPVEQSIIYIYIYIYIYIITRVHVNTYKPRQSQVKCRRDYGAQLLTAISHAAAESSTVLCTDALNSAAACRLCQSLCTWRDCQPATCGCRRAGVGTHAVVCEQACCVRSARGVCARCMAAWLSAACSHTHPLTIKH